MNLATSPRPGSDSASRAESARFKFQVILRLFAEKNLLSVVCHFRTVNVTEDDATGTGTVTEDDATGPGDLGI